MAGIPNLLMSKAGGAFNQVQQRLVESMPPDGLSVFVKTMQGQTPQVVSQNVPTLSGSEGQPAQPPYVNQYPPRPMQPIPYYPVGNAYYGYGRPLTVGTLPPSALPNPFLWANPTGSMVPQTQPYAVPSGYINRALAPVGPLLYPPYS